MSNPSLLDAIRVVKENERLASASYADAAHKISSEAGRQLFQQLSEFEKFHYDQISLLETSLSETGEFIDYAGRDFPQPPVFEIKAVQESNAQTVMGIISASMDLEKQAEKAYADLASQAVDPRGHNMFNRLSDEEHKHFRLLQEAFWTLNNMGIWTWKPPRP